jgi:hypothetical protein
MVIYGHNLHEKLLGIALSEDYIKYATPYCDFLSDPKLKVDISLAINYNKAINGNADAARNLIDTLILSGGDIDMTTKNFYRDKMINRPFVFGNEISRVNRLFERASSGDGESKFLSLLKDCLNSPCNLFAPFPSDSIGRAAQVGSTKSFASSFSIGSLKDVLVNVIDGVDQTITNKIPKIFTTALVGIGQTVENAASNCQAVIAGKKNLDELVELARGTGTMRATSKIYRYTPDIKSYGDYSSMSVDILTKIKEELGGCFESFEQSYRYNPYVDNTSTPIGIQTEKVDNREYQASPSGARLSKRTSVVDLSNTLNLPSGGSVASDALLPSLSEPDDVEELSIPF